MMVMSVGLGFLSEALVFRESFSINPHLLLQKKISFSKISSLKSPMVMAEGFQNGWGLHIG